MRKCKSHLFYHLLSILWQAPFRLRVWGCVWEREQSGSVCPAKCAALSEVIRAARPWGPLALLTFSVWGVTGVSLSAFQFWRGGRCFSKIDLAVCFKSYNMVDSLQRHERCPFRGSVGGGQTEGAPRWQPALRACVRALCAGAVREVRVPPGSTSFWQCSRLKARLGAWGCCEPKVKFQGIKWRRPFSHESNRRAMQFLAVLLLWCFHQIWGSLSLGREMENLMLESRFCSMDFVSKSWTSQSIIMFYGSVEPALILICS